MALVLQDIFPLSPTQGSAATAKLLEPHTCMKEIYYPTFASLSEARVIYTKRIANPYYMFQYDYHGIMNWEYMLLEEFFRRMKGKYSPFYVVDWETPYTISAATSASLTVDRTFGLEAATGFGRNKLLIYNPAYSGTNKEIVTINSGETFTDTTILTSAVTVALATSGAKAYVLYPAMFDVDKLKGTVIDHAIQSKIVNYPGYGNKDIFGPVIDVSIVIMQIGAMK